MTGDIAIEYGGTRHEYTLARGENDELQFFAGIVDPIIPQQAEGAFGYNAQPFNVNTPLSFENWRGGSALVDAEPGSLTSNSYSYSQGVDASWGARAYLSAARTAVTNLTADWVRAAFTSLGVFVCVTDEVWEWTGSAFTSRLSSVTPTDIVEFGSRVYEANGTNAYRYTSNGTSWTTSTLGFTVDQFAVRSGQDGSSILWGITGDGELREATDPTNSGGWSAPTQIGDTWETINRMVVASDFIYVFKDEGIWSFDGLIVEDVFPAQQLVISGNGKQTILWQDGYIYTNYGNRLWQFDPAVRTLRQVFPVDGRQGHPEVNGTITALDGDGDDLYFGLKNAAGNTYLMKGRPSYSEQDSVWHTWVYLASSTVNVISVQRAGAIHANNPVVLTDKADVAGYYVLPRAGMRPEDDSNYRYETAGFIIGSAVDGGALLNSKLMTLGRLHVEAQTAARYAKLSYAVDGGSSYTALAQTQTGAIGLGVPSASVRFTRISYKVDMASDGNTVTPVLIAIGYDATPTTAKHRMWSFAVDVGSFQALTGGGKAHADAWTLIDHLKNASGKEVLLYDPRGRRFVCVLDDVEQGLLKPTGLKDRETYVIRAIEIGTQGYMSYWYGQGSTTLRPDMPEGATGDAGTTPTTPLDRP